MSLRRVWARLPRRWGWVGAALALLAGATLLRAPCDVTTHARFPLRPARLAHLLADFANQPHVGSWRVVADGSNYTTWRYAVTFECGARCLGRGAVAAHAEFGRAAPRHGATAASHRVRVTLDHCVTLPLLPWAQFCHSVETDSLVTGDDGAGALLTERARTHCAPLSVLSGACARALRQRRDAYLELLRGVLG